MKYHFKIHKEKNGYWAECLELEGCSTQGNNREELSKNMSEALNLYLSEPESSKVIFPLPKKKVLDKNVEKVAVSSEVAMAMLLRQLRVTIGYTQHQMKDALGIKHVSQYQRLENPETSNPQLKTIARIKSKFPDFPIEQIF